MSALLKVSDLSLSFGGIRALRNIDFEVAAGGVVGLIGPNGAGKTSLLNCISRVQRPSGGAITFDGHDLLQQPMHRLPILGVTRTFQNLELFDESSVLDNILVGCSPFFRRGILPVLLNLAAARRDFAAARAEAGKLVQLFGLNDVASTRVADLPFGTRKTVELARALAGRPRLLLLDEPAAGLNPAESRELGRMIRTFAEQRAITVVMVEHDMPLVMNCCDRIIALVHGEKVCDGTPEHVRSDPTVIAAYLGAETVDA